MMCFDFKNKSHLLKEMLSLQVLSLSAFSRYSRLQKCIALLRTLKLTHKDFQNYFGVTSGQR